MDPRNPRFNASLMKYKRTADYTDCADAEWTSDSPSPTSYLHGDASPLGFALDRFISRRQAENHCVVAIRPATPAWLGVLMGSIPCHTDMTTTVA